MSIKTRARFEYGLLAAIAVMVVFSICMMVGCSVSTMGDGKLGVRFGTDIAIYSHAANSDETERASSSLDSEPFVDWLLGKLIKLIPDTPDAEPVE